MILSWDWRSFLESEMKEWSMWFALLCLLFSSALPAAPKNSAGEVKVVPHLDLDRYYGLWYEIARLPNRFQKMCAGDVTATYKPLEDGTISVLNACIDSVGDMNTAEGVARLASSEGPNSKLEVRFAPSFLSFLPFVWGDYWVIDLDPEYRYSVVGNPDRSYLWILSRTPELDNSVYQLILDRVADQGYDPAALVRTPQSAVSRLPQSND
jgi:apolipoprotein D and lipocalin family protein